MSTPRWLIVVAALALAAAPASADLIDFEEPAFSIGDSLGTVVTATNTVTFSVDAGLDAYVHGYGTPTTAFVPDDTVAAATGFGDMGGKQFLSDEDVENIEDDPLTNNLPYRFSFLTPIVSLSMDLLDFRNDGFSKTGDKIVFTAWANDDFTGTVTVAQLTITGGSPDANWIHFSTQSGIGAFQSFTVDVSGDGDVGTGIDNVQFTTVPEPGTLLLLGSGLVGLRTLRRRRRGSQG